MTRAGVFAQMRTVICTQLACSAARVTDSADFRTDLKADSLDQVQLVAAFEERFDVVISDDEAAFAETVGTAVDIIHGKLERKGGRA